MEDTRRKIRDIPGGFGAGVGASIAMMLAMTVLRFTSNTVSIPELMEDSLTYIAGGEIEAFFINNLGVGGKALLLVSIIEGTLLLGGLLGLGFTKLWPVRLRPPQTRWLTGLLYGLVVGTLLNAVFLPMVGQGFFGASALNVTVPPEISELLYGSVLAPFGLPVALSMYILSIVFGLTLVALLPWRKVAPTNEVVEMISEPLPAQTGALGRRDFTKALGGGLLAVAGGGALWYGIKEVLAPPPVAGPRLVEEELPGDKVAQPGATQVAQVPGQPTSQAGMAESGFEGVRPSLVPEVTPTESFYITTKNFVDPTLDGNTWKLTFKGMVENPYSLTLKELQEMEAEDRTETLACISNSVGGSLIGNARWKGVSFADLLKKAGPKSGAVDVIVRGADGYSDSFTLDVALQNECLLAYEMNGEPLTHKHGYPARLLVPGIFGMKNCKWITEVELVNHDYKGYWQERGWSDPAPYLTMSRIDFPNKDRIEAKPIYIGGIAFAGDRGIKRVEVTTDGGKTWHDADVREPLSKYAWVLWTYPWKPEPGNHTIQVRATDGTGEVQTSKVQGTFPDGATGYHSKKVRVG